MRGISVTRNDKNPAHHPEIDNMLSSFRRFANPKADLISGNYHLWANKTLIEVAKRVALAGKGPTTKPFMCGNNMLFVIAY